jgi:type II secretory pathway pseudopilin PulG
MNRRGEKAGPLPENRFDTMIQSTTIRRMRCPAEEGYILVAVMFILVILILSLAVALPRVRADLQRDREVETMHRGKQYIRAIQLYYKKFGAYPPNVDALVKTSEIRFLRKKYIDPMTGKDDWKPILFGQNKAPMSMGFFGQALSGSAIAGIGPSGGNGMTGGAGATLGSSGLSSSPSGAFGSSSGSTFGSSSGSSSPFGAGSPGDNSTNTGTTGGSSSGTTGSTDASGNPTTGGSAFGSSTIGGQSSGGQTFGGAGIIGFSPASAKQSILVYKKKNHYNEWEFVYDPLADRMMQGGNTGTIGQPASSTSSPIGSSSFGGSNSSGSSFGGSTFGSPAAPTTTTPQQ